jgi:hypothetical protein
LKLAELGSSLRLLMQQLSVAPSRGPFQDRLLLFGVALLPFSSALSSCEYGDLP